MTRIGSAPTGRVPDSAAGTCPDPVPWLAPSDPGKAPLAYIEDAVSKKNKLFKQQAKKSAEHSAQLQYGADWEIAIKRHECGDFIAKAMFKLVKRTDDPYMDNFRWTEVGDPVGEKLYAEAVFHGCCGFADEVVHDPKTGRKFRVGFNFGH